MIKHSEVNWALFLDFLLKQIGKPYNFGIENDPKENDWNKYKAWDCAELVENSFYKIGLSLPDGSYNQAKVVKHVDVNTLLMGDLGFKHFPDTGVIHHVGIYVGNQKEVPCVIEAKGINYGVVLTPLKDYMNTSHFAFWGRHKEILDA